MKNLNQILSEDPMVQRLLTEVERQKRYRKHFETALPDNPMTFVHFDGRILTVRLTQAYAPSLFRFQTEHWRALLSQIACFSTLERFQILTGIAAPQESTGPQQYSMPVESASYPKTFSLPVDQDLKTYLCELSQYSSHPQLQAVLARWGEKELQATPCSQTGNESKV